MMNSLPSKDVAENLNTPVDVLVTLSQDENWEVRESAARNLNTPAETMADLAHNEEEYEKD
jgi:hypothetical protein